MKVQLVNAICGIAIVFFSAASAQAATLAWYRMGDDDGGAGSNSPSEGGGIAFSTEGTLNSSGSWPLLRGRPSTGTGVPTYSSNVPGAQIYDPIGNQTYDNEWSIRTSNTDGSTGSRANTGFDAQFSLEMFVYFDVTDMSSVRGMNFVNHNTGANGGFILAIENAVLNQDTVRVTINTVTPTPTQSLLFNGATQLEPHTWYHLGLIYKQNQDLSYTAELYIDHALDNSGAVAAGRAFGTGEFQVIMGNQSGGSSTRTITMDEFRYFNEAIDSSEFLQVVPEPNALILASIGVVGLACYRVRRRNARA